jgi:hypothetical protein
MTEKDLFILYRDPDGHHCFFRSPSGSQEEIKERLSGWGNTPEASTDDVEAAATWLDSCFCGMTTNAVSRLQAGAIG